MGIGTFGSFTQARLAIYAAQAGLQVTGNNISNINTLGYTRQRLEQSSLYIGGSDRYSSKYDLRIGQGVLCEGVSQLRDPYLDIRYRNETAHVGQMEEKLRILTNIANILDETGKGDQNEGADFGLVGADIAELESTLRALTTETGHQEFDNQVRAAALALCTKLNSYANRLQDEYNTAVGSLEDMVTKVNERLEGIRDLNESIRNSEIHGQEALELRDKRNVMIDELAKMIHIDVTYVYEDIGGGEQVSKLIIKLANDNPDSQVTSDSATLIDGVYGSQISIEQVPQMVEVTDNPDTWPYMKRDANGDLVPAKTRAEAAEQYVMNPNPVDGFIYLQPDGTPTDNPDEAAKEPYLRNDGTPIYVKPNGELTANRDEAKMINNPNFNITVSELRDSQNKLLFYTDKSKEEKVTDAAELAGLHDGSIPLVNEQDPRNPDGSYTIDVYRCEYGFYYKTTYTKTPSKETPLDDNDLYGGLQAIREMLTEEGEFCDKDSYMENYKNAVDPYRDADENALSKRGIPYYQKSLDLLAHQLAELFNNANNGYMVDSDGNYITEGVDEKGKPAGVPITITCKLDQNGNPFVTGGETQGTDKDGNPMTMEFALSSKLDLTKQEVWDALPYEVRVALEATGAPSRAEAMEAYLNQTKLDAQGQPVLDKDGKPVPNGIKVGVNLFSNCSDTNDGSKITASNISVSAAWLKGQALVSSFVADQGKTTPPSGASDNLLHMKYIMNEKQHFYPNSLDSTKDTANGDIMFTGTIHEMWNNVGFIMGQDQAILGKGLDTHETNALQIDTNRDSISSVDFNDEAMNLMMYAKSYNAACRLMTTIDSVLDKLINNTGMTT